jgi:Xaa-Pro aminopeptidase
MKPNIAQYKEVQLIAEQIMSEVPTCIEVGKTEMDISNACLDLIKAANITDFWYYNTPVIVAVGSHTSISLSGKNYVPDATCVKENDLITVDLSIAIDHHWGILAKSFAIEEGEVKHDQFKDQHTLHLQRSSHSLHEYLMQYIKPDMTYHEVYHAFNTKTLELGVEHLDFKKNFGHSVEKNLDDRIYIADGVYEKIKSDTLFSFEPHLKMQTSAFGFKSADIYYFEGNQACKLTS